MKKRKREKLNQKEEARKREWERVEVLQQEEEREIERIAESLKKANRTCALCEDIYNCVRRERIKWNRDGKKIGKKLEFVSFSNDEKHELS